MIRKAFIDRKTAETSIHLALVIDGSGTADIATGVPFLDHMLTLFAKHGMFDLSLKVKGDIEVDFHHTTEDVGICLGQAFKQALGDYMGIIRYASNLTPMDETLCEVAIDISNRACLVYHADFSAQKVGDFDVELGEEFFTAFVSNARLSLHIDVRKGRNGHHILESIFKGVALALDYASQIDPRKKKIVPSTKGML